VGKTEFVSFTAEIAREIYTQQQPPSFSHTTYSWREGLEDAFLLLLCPIVKRKSKQLEK
jgi:hypothetical protein